MITSMTLIEECRFGLDGGAMFGIVPRPLWSRAITADEKNRIDTGMGTKWGDKEAGIYALSHPKGSLLSQLADAGLPAESITDVLLTHLHFDHAGGLTKAGPKGPTATFPQATHWVQRENWSWAHHPSDRDAGSYRQENFAFLASPGGPELRLIDGNATLFDAITVMPLRGHTPGMQALRFDVDGRTLLYAADLIPTSHHLPIAWVMGYDVNPLDSVDEKRWLLGDAAKHGWVLAYEHDADVAFSRVAVDDRGRFSAFGQSSCLADVPR
jgi:glyoxylase-like metal-dependent hydrolase (beta-lactamase superfamily II)